LQLGIPFPIYVLSEQESLKILMKAPKEVGVGKKHDPEAQEARAARKRKKARRKQAKVGRRRAGVA